MADHGEAAVPAVGDSEGVGDGVARVEHAPLVHERHPFGPADRAPGQVAVPRDPLLHRSEDAAVTDHVERGHVDPEAVTGGRIADPGSRPGSSRVPRRRRRVGEAGVDTGSPSRPRRWGHFIRHLRRLTMVCIVHTMSSRQIIRNLAADGWMLTGRFAASIRQANWKWEDR